MTTQRQTRARPGAVERQVRTAGRQARGRRLVGGPYDADDLDPEATDASCRVDFGAVLVPVPAGGSVVVEPATSGRLQAVHVSLPEGRLSISALAAPKSSMLWPELAREIAASLRDGGARLRSHPGEWGRELHATTGGATSVFVGADGPRWMLYGVATGPSRDAVALDGELRRMLRSTVVVRGRSPYPVRTVLPLVVPEHLAEAAGAPTDDAVRRDGTTSAARTGHPGPAVEAGSSPRRVAAHAVHPPSDATSELAVIEAGGPHAPVDLGGHGPGPADRERAGGADRQPALAMLLADPLTLFTPADQEPRPGRHHLRG